MEKRNREIELERQLQFCNKHINDLWRLNDEASSLMVKLFFGGIFIGAAVASVFWMVL